MTALLAKMNRNAIQPLSPVPAEEPEPAAPVEQPVESAPEPKTPATVNRGGRKKKDADAVSRPARPARTAKAASAADFETYRAQFLTRDKEEEMGGLRVQLSRRNSLDLKFIASCTGVTLTAFLNNVLRHHIETHADLLKSLTRPALSWEERDKDNDHEQ